MRTAALILLLLGRLGATQAENGYRLWLRYDRIEDQRLLREYRLAIPSLDFPGSDPIISAARTELLNGLQGLFGEPGWLPSVNGVVIIGTPASSPFVAQLPGADTLSRLGDEGFTIREMNLKGRYHLVIAAFTSKGILYGVFRFLRVLQTHQPLRNLNISEAPAYRYRILDHWDNLNRVVERGYAGLSLWDWWTLPAYRDPRYADYARANASVGINGTVLNNVNASPIILLPEWLSKAAALADIFRPYGIRVYLSVKWSSPIEIGGLKTADPLDTAVRRWWKDKVAEIYRYIPDFGGLLVKANSEGQPGPQNYGRTHADGANMLAAAIAPYHGIVIWRAFVYSTSGEDRAKQAYDEFKPLDGRFSANVLVQIKNGPIDFQPREPFHPLFGAMPRTPLLLEVQLTQEYLGFSNHLVYLAPLFAECLNADTHTQGTGPVVASTISGIAGVANTGNDINWCGHPFAAANWYAFGRLAWNPRTAAAEIADDWIRQTFTNDPGFVAPVSRMMLASREIAVDYMTPLGLHHIMGYGHHYGPAPWYDKAPRADWNPVYFHRADSVGLGFDRTVTGSNALEQYAPGARSLWEDARTCPDTWLLWFHHVPWNWRMHSGRTLWEELCYRYYAGVDSVRWMQRTWDSLRGRIDEERWSQVSMLLGIQEHDAVWWRNACLLYFQTFSRLPLPPGREVPDHTLSDYENIQLYFAP
ncbi:MAG TPA: alpha-glucuronidase family glycosyl hydrolase [Puia sp.]|nr:alpha-glucuronidase family glycosyl hydrolase [Puia sp.]